MIIKTKCDVCGRLYRDVEKHKSRQHAALHQQSVGKESGNSSSVPAPLTKFISSRSPGLTVIIRPTRRGFINTSGGSMETMIDGKSVNFINGILETNDPEVIDYLNTKYRDRRYPVVNMSKSGAK